MDVTRTWTLGCSCLYISLAKYKGRDLLVQSFIFRCGPILASYFLIYFANRIFWRVPTDTQWRGRDTLWYAIFPCFSGVRSKKSRTLTSTSGTRRNYWILTIKDAQIKPGQCVLTILEVDLLIYFASEIYKQKPAKAGFWVLSSSAYWYTVEHACLTSTSF